MLKRSSGYAVPATAAKSAVRRPSQDMVLRDLIEYCMPDSDAHLLERIAAGEQAAFCELYDRHAAQVFGLLLKLLHRPAEAEDVLQEVFWQVWRTAGRYDPNRASPLAWLFLIARSRAVDHLRRRSNAPAAADVEEVATEQDPFDSLAQHESAERMRAALAQLPDVQRSAICLAFYGGLTYELVAQRQQIPVGTAKTRIRLGMRQLRTLLREEVEVSG